MNSLPKELENIVSQYEHNLKMKDVLDELIEKKYNCRICINTCHQTIHPILTHCKCCKKPICVDCNDVFICPQKARCNDCTLQHMIIYNIGKIINNDIWEITKGGSLEYFDLLNWIYSLSTPDKDELLCYLSINYEDIIENDDEFLSLEVICDDIEYTIENDFAL